MTVDQFRSAIFGYVVSLNKTSVQYKMAKRYGLIEETEINLLFFFEKIEKGLMFICSECNRVGEAEEVIDQWQKIDGELMCYSCSPKQNLNLSRF